jgi:RNA polymerase sigma-70 factor (ECF subfamily)
LAQTADGPAEFESIALRHLPALYNLARWLTRNDHDAEDLVQEAVLRAFRSWHQLRAGDARAWLLSIVRNTYFTQWRDDKRHRVSDMEFDEELHTAQVALAPDNNPETLYASEDARKTVNDALARLPDIFREAVVLKEIEDLSYKEIAAVTGVPIGTVMSRLARGRKLLTEYLQASRQGADDALRRVPHRDARLH